MPIREMAETAVGALEREFGDQFIFGKPQCVRENRWGHTFNATIPVTDRPGKREPTYYQMQRMATLVRNKVKVDPKKMPQYDSLRPATHHLFVHTNFSAMEIHLSLGSTPNSLRNRS